MNQTPSTNPKLETAVFGGGCFWCTEAVFSQLKGVVSVTSGYAGGAVANPTYSDVTDGTTGHAEVIKIEYDPTQITYDQLLEIFWEVHDPTSLNRQGADVGTQYRSIILYTTAEQKEQAETAKKTMQNSGRFQENIVTEIKPLETFYTAEEYHQRYYDQNQSQPYCQVVIAPKVEKLLQRHPNLVKNS